MSIGFWFSYFSSPSSSPACRYWLNSYGFLLLTLRVLMSGKLINWSLASIVSGADMSLSLYDIFSVYLALILWIGFLSKFYKRSSLSSLFVRSGILPLISQKKAWVDSFWLVFAFKLLFYLEWSDIAWASHSEWFLHGPAVWVHSLHHLSAPDVEAIVQDVDVVSGG